MYRCHMNWIYCVGQLNKSVISHVMIIYTLTLAMQRINVIACLSHLPLTVIHKTEELNQAEWQMQNTKSLCSQKPKQILIWLVDLGKQAKTGWLKCIEIHSRQAGQIKRRWWSGWQSTKSKSERSTKGEKVRNRQERSGNFSGSGSDSWLENKSISLSCENIENLAGNECK